MASRRVKGLKQSGRVSISKARKAAHAIKKARSGAVPKSVVVTAGKTATGRHLVTFRFARHPG